MKETILLPSGHFHPETVEKLKSRIPGLSIPGRLRQSIQSDKPFLDLLHPGPCAGCGHAETGVDPDLGGSPPPREEAATCTDK